MTSGSSSPGLVAFQVTVTSGAGTWGVEIEAGGGLTRSGAQVKPAEFVRRVRAKLDRADPESGAEAEVVAAAPVIDRGELAEIQAGR